MIAYMNHSYHDVLAGRRHRAAGPHLGILGIVVLVLTIAGLALPALIAGGVTVSPLSGTSSVVAYYRDHPFASTVNGFFLAASSVPLGIYAATGYTAMRRRGRTVPGPAIAFYGGIAA